MTKEEVLKQVEVTQQILGLVKILFPLLEEVYPDDRDKVFDNLIQKLSEQKKTGVIYHFPSDALQLDSISKILKENEQYKKLYGELGA